MVLKQFSLPWDRGIEIREFWSIIVYNFPGIKTDPLLEEFSLVYVSRELTPKKRVLVVAVHAEDFVLAGV